MDKPKVTDFTRNGQGVSDPLALGGLPGGGPGPPPAGPDPFDPASFRLPDQSGDLKAAPAPTAVAVRKPDKFSFVRTHRDPDYRVPTKVIEFKERKEVYLVARELWPDLEDESAVVPRLLVPTITRQGVLTLWPLRMPGPDGRFDDWGRSEREAAARAQDEWVRVAANLADERYDVRPASGVLPDPSWPALTLPEWLRLAFGGRYIASLDHLVLRQLRGDV